MESKRLVFPDSFFWGAGTSAIQVEGDNLWSDWERLNREKKFIKSGEEIGKCADHYHRYKEDFALAKELNHNSHRFTIEWSRIEKEEGVFDPEEIEHYRNVIKQLRYLGIEPFPTLHHFSSPDWFSKIGGWENKRAVKLFARFAEKIAQEYKDDVSYWLVINEPNTYIGLGCIAGLLPPLKNNPISAYKTIRNMARSHNLAYQKIKFVSPESTIGSINNVQLLTSRKGDVDGIYRDVAHYLLNYYFTNKTKDHVDIIGINYYFPYRRAKKNTQKTDMGWEIYPKGIHDSISQVWAKYQKPIFITENGIADAKDVLRSSYIRDHLIELHRAIEAGIDIRGYFYWTLLDNLELHEGYWPKFGLIDVDFDTYKRSIKPSARYYADICRTNSIEIN